MVIKRLLILLLLVLSLCTVVSAQEPNEFGFEGVWKGSGSQDRTTFWTIKITVSENKYLIDYPSVRCGGRLILTNKNDERIEFRESLTYGRDKCINNGKVILVKDGSNHILFQWYYKNGKKGARGTLTRQQQDD